MALYNGQDTKEKILISARQLFYEKGYDETTFRDIANLAEINQGSIYYHFRTKSNLGKTIYREIAKENFDIARKFFLETTNVLTCFLIGSNIYWHMFFKDASYRKFNVAATAEKSNLTVDDYDELFVEAIRDYISQELLKDKMLFYLTVSGSIGYTKSLGISVSEKIEELTADEVWKFDAEKFFYFFEIDQSILKETINQATSCFHQLEIKNDGFHVTAILKKEN